MAAVSDVEFGDIQGLLRFGFKHHTQAVFLLLRVRDRSAARAWLAAAPLTSAQSRDPPPPTALQVALSAEGLRALGVADDVIDGFSAEFVSGLGTNPDRSRRLGDVAGNDPSHWDWGAGARVPHLLLMLYALPGRLADFEQSVEAQCTAGFERLARLETSDMDGVEPFGFADGVSQPEPDWQRARPVRDETRTDYVTTTCLGEFVLGLPNEYGGYTDRPLLDPARDPQGLLPRADDAPARADLGRHGSYLVLRQLGQDVAGFWQWLDRAAGGDAARREQLAAAMVGRQRDGTPLAAPGGADLNHFDYDADPRGLRCPLGAHIRRSNPRNADLPAGTAGVLSKLVRTLGFDAPALRQDLVASTRFHRLLRRGREYGAPLTPDAALVTDPATAGARGLHFIVLNANIGRQFEFVQGAWINGPHFNGLSGEGDPLLGSREPGADGRAVDGFSLPQADGPDARLTGLPSFVRVHGGAYFFLPGLRALRWLVTAV